MVLWIPTFLVTFGIWQGFVFETLVNAILPLQGFLNVLVFSLEPRIFAKKPTRTYGSRKPPEEFDDSALGVDGELIFVKQRQSEIVNDHGSVEDDIIPVFNCYHKGEGSNNNTGDEDEGLGSFSVSDASGYESNEVTTCGTWVLEEHSAEASDGSGRTNDGKNENYTNETEGCFSVEERKFDPSVFGRSSTSTVAA